MTNDKPLTIILVTFCLTMLALSVSVAYLVFTTPKKVEANFYRGCVASAYQSTDVKENLKYCTKS